MEKLYLFDNNIGDDGMKALADPAGKSVRLSCVMTPLVTLRRKIESVQVSGAVYRRA